MINWDEVTVGETDTIKSTEGRIVEGAYKAANIQGDLVGWTKQQSKSHFTFFPKEDWTIYDPWEEITDQCRWGKWVKMGDGHYWMLHHDGKPVSNDHVNYKSDGRRVWKRKEG